MNPKLRVDVARISRKLHAMGWVANHDGNVSVRAGRDRYLITPTAVSKADVDGTMLIVVDGDGKVVEGTRKPFSEMDLHLAAYRARADVEAVVHAHPPFATAFGVAGAALEPVALPEAVVSIGSVPTAPFAMPKTPESAAAVASLAVKADAMLLPGNGALTLGRDLEQAYLRMELVEHLAKILWYARALGGARALTPEQIAKLLEAREKAGLGPP